MRGSKTWRDNESCGKATKDCIFKTAANSQGKMGNYTFSVTAALTQWFSTRCAKSLIDLIKTLIWFSVRTLLKYSARVVSTTKTHSRTHTHAHTSSEARRTYIFCRSFYNSLQHYCTWNIKIGENVHPSMDMDLYIVRQNVVRYW